MLILALDCSTSRGSAAIGRAAGATGDGAVVLWERSFPAGRGHGGELFSTLQEGMQAVTPSSGPRRYRLERIIVGLGPGSYSGVRQAIAVATGLSLTAGAQLVGSPSSAALETDRAEYHAVGDARRGTFYYTAVQGRRVVDGPILLEDVGALLARLALHPTWPILMVESVSITLPVGMEAAIALPRAARLLNAHPSSCQEGVLEPIYLRPPAVTLPKPRVER